MEHRKKVSRPKTHRPSTHYDEDPNKLGAGGRDIREKCKALKQENAKLVSSLYNKDSQAKSLESQLKKLEKEFLQYRNSCEKILSLNGLTADPTLLGKAEEVLSVAQDSRPVPKKIHPRKVCEYVKANKLDRALKISLMLSQELLNKYNEPSVDHSDAADDSLIRESECLLQSINKQSSKISKIIRESEGGTPKAFKK